MPRAQFNPSTLKVSYNPATEKVQVTKPEVILCYPYRGAGGGFYKIHLVKSNCTIYKGLQHGTGWGWGARGLKSFIDTNGRSVLLVLGGYNNAVLRKIDLLEDQIVWTATLDLDGYIAACGNRIVIDSEGYIYVCGRTSPAGTGIVKIRDNGSDYTIIWSKGDSDGISDYCRGLWIESDCIFIAHENQNSFPDYIKITKINLDGSVVWKSLGGFGSGALRNVCLIGGSVFAIPSDSYYIEKYGADGVYQDHVGIMRPIFIAPDNDNNLICCGSRTGPSHDHNLMKFDTSLNLLDSVLIGGDDPYVPLEHLVIAPSGEIYIIAGWEDEAYEKMWRVSANFDEICSYTPQLAGCWAHGIAFLELTISGTVTLAGSGLAGVTMTGLPGNPITNASGVYSAQVNEDWSGTVTPVKAGYTFLPASGSYSNVSASLTGQDYVAS